VGAVDIFSATEPCEYEGSRKVISRDGHASPLLCVAHAEEWFKNVPGCTHIARPRLLPGEGESHPCQANWPFTGAVPG